MTRPTTLPDVWRALAEACGGVDALCEELGINQSTLWRWAHEENEVPMLGRLAVSAVAQQKGVASPVVTHG